MDFCHRIVRLTYSFGSGDVTQVFYSWQKSLAFCLEPCRIVAGAFAGFIDSASEQTLRIPVFRDAPNNEAFTSEGERVFLDKPLQLTRFTVEHYDNGTPRYFFAEVSLDGKPVHLEVNHPYSAGWGEDYYLTSYDVQSSEPAYCVVQIVREPLKYVMLAGIVMMLCGGFLLFLGGPDRNSKSVLSGGDSRILNVD